MVLNQKEASLYRSVARTAISRGTPPKTKSTTIVPSVIPRPPGRNKGSQPVIMEIVYAMINTLICRLAFPSERNTVYIARMSKPHPIKEKMTA